MACITTCVIGFMLLGGILLIMLLGTPKSLYKLQTTLSPSQLDVYKKITKHRRDVFIWGLVLGLLVFVLYVGLNYGKYNFTQLNTVCLGIFIILGVAYLFYSLVPKDMLLGYLDKREQVILWEQVYKNYSYRSTLGMVLAIAAFVLIYWGMTKNTLVFN